MIQPGRIKLIAVVPTLVEMGSGRSPQGYKLLFSIDGEGQYEAIVPKEGFTKELGEEAMLRVATPIIELKDAFPGA